MEGGGGGGGEIYGGWSKDPHSKRRGVVIQLITIIIYMYVIWQ